MAKIFQSLRTSQRTALLAALVDAGLSVTAVAGGIADAGNPLTSGHTATNGMRLCLTWSVAPSAEQFAAASAVIAAFDWTSA